jgi:hypothetical protein
MRWVEHVACMGEERKVYTVSVVKPEGKRPLGRKTSFLIKITVGILTHME